MVRSQLLARSWWSSARHACFCLLTRLLHFALREWLCLAVGIFVSMDTIKDTRHPHHDRVDLAAQCKTISPSCITMVLDGSLVLHICTDSISPIPCITSQERLLGTSVITSVQWWSRSSLHRALMVTLAPSHQITSSRKSRTMLVISCQPTYSTERATKQETGRLEQGTGNEVEPILSSKTIVVGATRVRS